MALRAPKQYRAALSAAEERAGALNQEIEGEIAYSLGRIGKRVEASLAALSRFEAQVRDARPGETAADEAERERLRKDAAGAVHAYFIQRELCGLRHHRDAIEHFAIPPAILARLGAR